jgi:L-lactate dehydrogenase complex protein LldG
VRAALAVPTSHGRGELEYDDLPAPPVRERPENLLALLAESAAELNIQLTVVDDAAGAAAEIRAIVARTEPEWDHQRGIMVWDAPLLEELGVAGALTERGMGFYRAPGAEERIDAARRAKFYRQLGEARIGITTADFCVADTATLVLRNRPGQPAAVSLVPSVHVAVVREAQMLPDFNALYERLDKERKEDPAALPGRMILISGPSKTGDIELVMVHGAHGPRVLHLIVIRDEAL